MCLDDDFGDSGCTVFLHIFMARSRQLYKEQLIERSLTHTGNGQKESSALVMWTGQTGSSGSGLGVCTRAQGGC